MKRVAVKDRPFTRQIFLCLKNECFDEACALIESVVGTSSSKDRLDKFTRSKKHHVPSTDFFNMTP